MANNFEKNQGELLRFNLSLKDTKGFPVALTTGTGTTPVLFFAGSAKYTGSAGTVQSFSFEYNQKEANIPVRGSNAFGANEVYKVDAFLSADITSTMAAGSWNYTIKYSDKANPSANDNVSVLLEGVITLNSAVTVNPDTTGSAFVTPSNPS
tara:strand:+ start:7108 stop:7563 length:456 start_codon:yes stop_codon:yes gene_type:complete